MKTIIISAYAFSPIRGSEAAVGWEICNGLSKYFKIHVVFCEKTPKGDSYYQESIEFYKEFPNENVILHPIKMPVVSKFWTFLHDIGIWPFYYLGYNCWQRAAYRKVRELIKSDKFDILYQLNMIGFREPGYLWKIDLPFVWGPVGGFHLIPLGFLKSMPPRDALAQLLKHFVNKWQMKINVRPKLAAKKAQLIFCVDKVAMEKLLFWGGRPLMLQETGLKIVNDISSENRFSKNDILQLVWSGTIDANKSLDILLEAMLILESNRIHLTILGDGPNRKKLMKEYHCLDNILVWMGWQKRKDALTIMAKSHLLVHTSLKEGTPHVVLESLGMCIPVICHDTCGMAEVVNVNNGFKLRYLNKKESINQIVETLNSILENEKVLNDRVDYLFSNRDSLTWERKVAVIAGHMSDLFITNNP